MAAFLPSPHPSDSDSSDLEIDMGTMKDNPWEDFQIPSSVPIKPPPPQTPGNQINVKKLILYNGLYYEPGMIERVLSNPKSTKKQKKEAENIKTQGKLVDYQLDILGDKRPMNIRRRKPPPGGLLPTKRSTYSHKKLIEGLKEADKIKSPFDIEDRTSLSALEVFPKKKGGKRKTKKRRKKRNTKKRNKAGSLRKTKRIRRTRRAKRTKGTTRTKRTRKRSRKTKK